MIAIVILSVCLFISLLWSFACFFAVKAMQQDIHDKNKQIEFLTEWLSVENGLL